MSKIIVFSDIHFGCADCNLDISDDDPDNIMQERVEKIDSFFEWLNSDHSNIDECILLGDIFDLHLANFNRAIVGSYYFLEKLAHLPNLKKITYIPGNHDHTLWLLHIYHWNIIKELESAVHPQLDLNEDLKCVNRFFKKPPFPSFLEKLFSAGNDVEVRVTYPNYKKEQVGGKNYVFFHGHFLSKKQKISRMMFKRFVPVIDSSDLQELEVLCSPQYETLFLLAQCPQGRIGLLDWYKGKLGSWLDCGKHVNQFNKRIRIYLLDSGLEIGNAAAYFKLDYVIFGHTHRAGIGHFRFRKNPKLISMNTGSWENSKDKFGEFIIIDKNASTNTHPQLYEYKWTEPTPNLHDETKMLNKKGIPFKKVVD